MLKKIPFKNAMKCRTEHVQMNFEFRIENESV